MWETVDRLCWLIITPVIFYEATRGHLRRLSANFSPAPALGRGIITHVSRVLQLTRGQASVSTVIITYVSRATADTWRQAI